MYHLIQDSKGLFLKSLNPEVWHPDRSQAWVMTTNDAIAAIFQFESDPEFLDSLEIMDATDEDFFDAANLMLDAIQIDLSEVEDGYIQQSNELRNFNGDLSELM